jgi:hypothetical protein
MDQLPGANHGVRKRTLIYYLRWWRLAREVITALNLDLSSTLRCSEGVIPPNHHCGRQSGRHRPHAEGSQNGLDLLW